MFESWQGRLQRDSFDQLSSPLRKCQEAQEGGKGKGDAEVVSGRVGLVFFFLNSKPKMKQSVKQQ